MPFDFNADEIFEIACRIERNGAQFYREMSEKITLTPIRKMLLDFAAMEEAHEKVFNFMRKNLTDDEKGETVFDPEEETSQYLRAMADLHVFDSKAEEEFVLSDVMSEEAKARKILRAAINREWGSIALYLGIKDLVPEKLGKGKIDHIIKEEMMHVKLLSNSLTSLKA
jgi:rubrerythrin